MEGGKGGGGGRGGGRCVCRHKVRLVKRRLSRAEAAASHVWQSVDGRDAAVLSVEGQHFDGGLSARIVDEAGARIEVWRSGNGSPSVAKRAHTLRISGIRNPGYAHMSVARNLSSHDALGRTIDQLKETEQAQVAAITLLVGRHEVMPISGITLLVGRHGVMPISGAPTHVSGVPRHSCSRCPRQ